MNNGAGDFSSFSSTWSPGWELHPARLDVNALEDLFLFDPASGLWFCALADGGAAFA